MKNRFLLALMVVAVAAMAFTVPSATKGEGIKFSEMGLAEAMSAAKKSGRLIFIDVHASWCGPCKIMAKTTFQSETVGKVFNSKFINLKIDGEKDKDGPELMNVYSVAVYPTLLFIDGDGKLVKKLVGSQTEEKLLAEVNKLSR